jgi:hypothetical protein
MNSPELQRLLRRALKNWDTYAVIFLALIFGVGGVIGEPLQWVVSGTLLVLGLLAYSSLRLRLSEEDKQQVFVQKEQREAYSRLIEEYVKHKQIKKAVLIQYSCTTAISLLEELLIWSESVVLYVQSEDIPGNGGSREQAERIAWSLTHMPGELRTHYNAEKLAIYKYHVPGSITAVKIDDDVILMGWYFYLHVNDDDEKPHKDRNGDE